MCAGAFQKTRAWLAMRELYHYEPRELSEQKSAYPGRSTFFVSGFRNLTSVRLNDNARCTTWLKLACSTPNRFSILRWILSMLLDTVFLEMESREAIFF